MSADEVKQEAGRQGGLARKEALSPEQLKAQAQRAAAVRWNKPLVATNRGNFSEELGMDVDCYVLGDALRTAVISQTGMGKAIGLSKRGSALPRFLESEAASSVAAELREKLRNPVKFQWGSGGAEQPPTEVHGYDATILIDLCKAIVKAEADGKLKSQQKKLATHAATIISASAKLGIRNLVWALAGFNPTADQVIQAFKLYVQEEARKYEKEFPNELYAAWHKLYQIPVPQRGKPWQFKHLTVNHIYSPLAQSRGKVLELIRIEKARHGDRKTKLFQFLNEIGARALRIQIGRILEMAEDSETPAEYESRVHKRFGGQQEFDFTPATSEAANESA
jgi:hypothetical protein